MTLRDITKTVIICTLAMTVCTPSFSKGKTKSDWDRQARQRKAEYLFLESQTAYYAREFDKYVRLVERAYELDSTDIDIAGEWATLCILDENSDSAKIDRAYDILRQRFDAYPENYINGTMLTRVANQLGRYDDAVEIWEKLQERFPSKPEIPLQLAHAYLRSFAYGDSLAFDKAMAIYDRLEEGSGPSTDLTSEKIQAYYIKGDSLAVVNELKSLYSQRPDDSYTAIYIGANYQYLNMPDEAIKYYNLACELDSTNGQAYLQRAKFYMTQNDSVAFDREVFLALKSQNLDAEDKTGILRSYVSELYTDSTQEPRIRELFGTLEQLHPGEADIHALYGAYLYEIKDYPGASEQFSYAAALNPTDISNWLSYVQTSGLANDTLTVYTAAAEAMERFPEEIYFPNILASVYRINGNLPKAIAVLDSVDLDRIANNRAKAHILTSKGDTYAAYGDTIQALKVYDEALEYDPENSMALNNAAYFITLTGGDLDKAERYSARSLQGDELNPTYLDTYAWVFFHKKDYPMAKQYIDIALNAYKRPVDTDSVVNWEIDIVPDDPLGGGQSTSVNLDDSIDEVEVVEAYEDEPEDASADILDHAGDIYFMNGEREQAIKFWEEAHALDPDDPIIEKKVKEKTIYFR